MPPEATVQIAISATSIIISALGCAVTYGILTGKVDRLESDHKECLARQDSMEEKFSHFVPMNHFDAVVKPLQDSMKEIERDIKKILIIVTKSGLHDSETN